MRSKKIRKRLSRVIGKSKVRKGKKIAKNLKKVLR
jgi:hypothetical protein